MATTPQVTKGVVVARWSDEWISWTSPEDLLRAFWSLSTAQQEDLFRTANWAICLKLDRAVCVDAAAANDPLRPIGYDVDLMSEHRSGDTHKLPQCAASLWRALRKFVSIRQAIKDREAQIAFYSVTQTRFKALLVRFHADNIARVQLEARIQWMDEDLPDLHTDAAMGYDALQTMARILKPQVAFMWSFKLRDALEEAAANGQQALPRELTNLLMEIVGFEAFWDMALQQATVDRLKECCKSLAA